MTPLTPTTDYQPFSKMFTRTKCRTDPLITKKNPAATKVAGFFFCIVVVLFLVAVLSVDSLDLLTYEVHVVFQLLNLAVHLVNEAVALL